ncbi:MFS transporter (plasmid) [Streptomyces sp. NBC_00637]|uniref:MFS transporter n=1 Tax=Streptomyces sp. NBC_00637 TaxID=2903667 RepID=UPI002F914432
MTTAPVLPRQQDVRTARYRDILTTRYVPRLLSGAVIGHLPVAMAPVALLLAARADGATLQTSGLLAAVFGLTAALGQPAWGRLLDRRGHLKAVGAPALLSGAAFTLLAFVRPADHPVLAAVLTAAAGLSTPPTEAALRVVWPAILRHEAERRAALALDACAQEVVFIVGPLLVLALQPAGPVLLLSTTAAAGLAGTALLLSASPARTWQATVAHSTDWLGPLRARGLQALAAVLFGVGITLGSLNVYAVAAAESHAAPHAATLIPAALAVGSLLGGLCYGSRRWPGAPVTQLGILGAGFLTAALPLLTDPAPGVAIAAALLPGVFLAPLLVVSFHTLDVLVTEGTLAEASAWLVACLGLGQAAGTALSGLVSHQAPEAAAAVGVAGAAASCVLLVLTRRSFLPTGANW